MDGWREFVTWLGEVSEWTISQNVGGVWTDEQVIADWVVGDRSIAYVQIFGDHGHMLTLERLEVEPIGDGWKVTANGGLLFNIGLVYSNQQWADLARWQEFPDRVHVGPLLKELAGTS